MPTSGELRDALITKAEFWCTLVGAGELLVVVSQFVNTGDRAGLDALLTEVANQTDNT